MTEAVKLNQMILKNFSNVLTEEEKQNLELDWEAIGQHDAIFDLFLNNKELNFPWLKTVIDLVNIEQGQIVWG